LSNDELITQAQALGFRCEADPGGTLKIFPPEDKNEGWHLAFNGRYWVVFSKAQASLNLYPEDAMQFLQQRRQS